MEHEPDPGGAQLRQGLVGQPGDLQAGDADAAAGGLVQRAHQVQQGGLA
jgi:hypothetical protein